MQKDSKAARMVNLMGRNVELISLTVNIPNADLLQVFSGLGSVAGQMNSYMLLLSWLLRTFPPADENLSVQFNESLFLVKYKILNVIITVFHYAVISV